MNLELHQSSARVISVGETLFGDTNTTLTSTEAPIISYFVHLSSKWTNMKSCQDLKNIVNMKVSRLTPTAFNIFKTSNLLYFIFYCHWRGNLFWTPSPSSQHSYCDHHKHTKHNKSQFSITSTLIVNVALTQWLHTTD